MSEIVRPDGRHSNQLRPIKLERGVNPYAEGSAQISFGNTSVLITATVEREIPDWLKEKGEGWVTAEYAMLPRATHTRGKREAALGRQSGRTLEIQRLIGRALRAAVDLKTLGPLSIRLDCDVIVADGGTRTAAITGAWIALADAVKWAANRGLTTEQRLRPVAAISVGVLGGHPLLDLCYEEDSKAEFDMNVVLTGSGQIIEIQGSAERSTVSKESFDRLFMLAEKGIGELIELQQSVINHRNE